MTNLRRTIASTAAAVALAAGLLAGTAAPALAGPLPPSPITPGPSVPPIPPGTTIDLSVQFPPCTSVLLPRTIPATQVRLPDFGWYGYTPSGVYGARDFTLTQIIRTHRSQTCAFGAKGVSVYVTETAINSSDYAVLNDWYRAHSSYALPGGGPTLPGTAADTFFTVGTSTFGGVNETAILSPDGWWITVLDNHGDVLPYLAWDATERFLQYNPTRS
ncbi:MAG: hypothetical protein JWP32_1343 [Schumannella sp.]|nr:hypothetical protein [Schumannella sp.]